MAIVSVGRRMEGSMVKGREDRSTATGGGAAWGNRGGTEVDAG